MVALQNAPKKEYSEILNASVLLKTEFEVFSTWSEQCYTRNCIFETRDFELILLCWEADQETPVHGHGGEKCWVKIIDGQFKETLYHSNDNRTLKEVKNFTSTVNDLSYMDDGMGFHKLKNINNGRSMSLHLYAKPIRHCQQYDANALQFVQKTLRYNTKPELGLNIK